MKLLRDRGYTVEKVEQRLPIPGKFVTRDFGGFADLIAFRAGQRLADFSQEIPPLVEMPGEIIAIQVTSASNLSARSIKVRANPKARIWLRAGGRILLHGWKNSRGVIENEIKEQP